MPDNAVARSGSMVDQRHWEISWTTIRPLTARDVEAAVRELSRLACSWPQFAVECLDGRFVAIRHRQDDELVLEFGVGDESQANHQPALSSAGLVLGGHITWNWCCTGKRQPETDLLLHKWRQVQSVVGDKLLIWDDDGTCHWSWGSCTLEQAEIRPYAIVDAHLHTVSRRLGQPS
jgi:hypothetical protein